MGRAPGSNVRGAASVGNLVVSLLFPAQAIAVNPLPIIAAVKLLMTGHGRPN